MTGRPVLTADDVLRVLAPVAVLRGRPVDQAEAAAWLWALVRGVETTGNPAHITPQEFEDGVARALIASRWAITPADVWEAVLALRRASREATAGETAQRRTKELTEMAERWTR